MHFTGIGHENMDWIHLAQENSPVMGCCEHGSELQFTEKAGERDFLSLIDHQLLKKVCVLGDI